MADGVDIGQAIATVRNGGVIAYPTEGVWGLGCDPRQLARPEHLDRAGIHARTALDHRVA